MGNDPVSEKTLSVTDSVAITVGIVIGIGIFKTPSLVAANAGTEWIVLLLWLIGGFISLVGALCYAELSTTYPHEGGDYHYFMRAFGNATAFLFAWARMTVIQTGSIAMLAFLVGDYASEVISLGSYSSSYYAGLTIIILTFINIAGIRQSRNIQKVLVGLILLGLFFVAIIGFVLVPRPETTRFTSLPSMSSLGKAMIFVLLTYGGWNEAVYLSAEVRDIHRNMGKILFYSIGVITAVYLIINFLILNTLGISDAAGSEVVVADLMRRALGERGAFIISLLITITAVSTVNGTIITGARTNFALGKDFTLFSFLGHWQEHRGTPVNALLLQGFISLILVILGSMTPSGFEMMVEYTAPVFWFFFLLTGISLLVLRHKEPDRVRPFRVPFYPFTPLLFCTFCIYMLRSSLVYTGKGALVGVIVLLAGIPFLLMKDSCRKINT